MYEVQYIVHLEGAKKDNRDPSVHHWLVKG